MVYYNYMTKYQRRCECNRRMNRTYIRQYIRTPHADIDKKTYRNRWKAIGWFCNGCKIFLPDKN